MRVLQLLRQKHAWKNTTCSKLLKDLINVVVPNVNRLTDDVVGAPCVQLSTMLFQHSPRRHQYCNKVDNHFNNNLLTQYPLHIFLTKRRIHSTCFLSTFWPTFWSTFCRVFGRVFLSSFFVHFLLQRFASTFWPTRATLCCHRSMEKMSEK